MSTAVRRVTVVVLLMLYVGCGRSAPTSPTEIQPPAVSSTAIPQLHEVSRVLKHMSTIAATDQSSTPVIDFEDDEKKLHITDPFFAFYLRWGNLATS